MDPNPSTTHPRRPGHQPRETVGQPMAQTHPQLRLVTPTVKRALSDAATDLPNTNNTIPSLLARPDPLTTNELVNELRPVSRLRPQIQSNHKFVFAFSSRIAFGSCQLRDCRSHGSVSGGGDEAVKQTFHFISSGMMLVSVKPVFGTFTTNYDHNCLIAMPQ